MTKQRLTCSLGHSWDHLESGPLPADLRAICPVCTVAGAESTLASPSGASLTGLPPGGGPSPLAPGQTLAGFEIIEEINRGGMGVIYKARQQGLNRLVALKVIMPERLGHADAMKRFQREVQAAAHLSHPNIVTVFHTDLQGPWPFLAMEYVAGIDLFRLVKQGGPLSVRDACAYVRQVALGLQHAFEQGLVHRDIKPANLMVTPSPLDKTASRQRRERHVKILDMGLARLTAPPEGAGVVTELTQAGEFLGTPDYIAPEQAEDSRKADIRSDLYSLGGTFYFLLTGEVPFPSGNMMQKLRRQLTEAPPSPAARRPDDVPPNVDAIVRQLMALEAADRFQTPAELILALDQVLVDPGSSSLGGARSKEKLRPPGAVVNAPSSHTPVSQVKAHGGGVQSLCISADGQLLLSAGLDQALRVWEPGRLREVRCIADDVGSVEQVCLAPNSKWAAACSLRLFQEDMVVQLWDLVTGKERRRLKGATGNLRCVAIAPDGRKVAASGADPVIRIWALDQRGNPSISLKGHTDQVNSLVFLSNGEALLSGGNDGLVRLWDIKTGGLKGTVRRESGPVAAVAYGGRRMAIAGQRLRVRHADGSFLDLNGHQGLVLCVAFSPDGRLLVSGGSDQTVRVWQTHDGKELDSFQGHGDKVRAVVISPDGKTIFSGGADGTIRRWPVPG